MADFIDDLNCVLKEAEASVLRILARAAEAADYAAIDRARRLAEKLRTLEKEPPGDKPRRQPTRAGQTSKGKRKTRTSAPGHYPRFRVSAGSLYKTGWSKKKGQEYEQRVPLEVVESVVAALDKLADHSDGAVTGEEIIESSELREAGQFPSYQVYNVLAMLRESGVIEAIGREGYRMPRDLGEKAKEAVLRISVAR